MNNYGLHIQQIVSDAHNAVTNLTERDTQDHPDQPTRWQAADTAALHISELVDE
jgi:hypothetical protein